MGLFLSYVGGKSITHGSERSDNQLFTFSLGQSVVGCLLF